MPFNLLQLSTGWWCIFGGIVLIVLAIVVIVRSRAHSPRYDHVSGGRVVGITALLIAGIVSICVGAIKMLAS